MTRPWQPAGLRGTQFSILQKLSVLGETTITGLAEVIAMDRTTMASNLKPLAREGLVTVEPSLYRPPGADRHTHARRAVPHEAALPLWKAVQTRFEDSFGDAEAAELRTSLEAVLHTGFTPGPSRDKGCGISAPSAARADRAEGGRSSVAVAHARRSPTGSPHPPRRSHRSRRPGVGGCRSRCLPEFGDRSPAAGGTFSSTVTAGAAWVPRSGRGAIGVRSFWRLRSSGRA